MKRLISENKVLFTLGLIIIICFVVMVVALVKYFYGGEGDPYGGRTNGIEDVPISENIDTDINEILKENKNFNEVVVNIKGKIIYINIDLTKDISLVDAQSLAIKSLDAFSDEEKAFYDIQLIVTTNALDEEEKESKYPIMGYKNAKGSKVIWTN